MFEENNDQTVADATEEFKRPVSITIICVLGFMGAVVAVPVILSPMAKMISPGYPALLGVTSVAGLICMIGLWNMKQWAAIMYVGLAIVNQVFLISMGLWSPLALIVPGIISIIALKHLDKCRKRYNKKAASDLSGRLFLSLFQLLSQVR